MIKYFIIIISLLNPLNLINKSYLKYNKTLNSSITAMSPPPGPAASKATRLIDAISDEGCSSQVTRKQKRDGTVIEHETLICKKKTIIKPSGEIKQEPKANSNKLQGPVMKNFFEDSNKNKKIKDRK